MRSAGLWLLVAAGCGATETSDDTLPFPAPVAEDCAQRQTPAALAFESDELFLNVADARIGRILVRADLRELSTTPEQYELEVRKPDGSVVRESFRHQSAEEACRGCDPVAGGGPDQCRNACEIRRRGAARIELPPHAADAYGEYTVVLRRVATDSRQSQRFVIGSPVDHENTPVCRNAPERVGPYRRNACEAGTLPVDTPTIFGSTRIGYAAGPCLADIHVRIAHVGGMRDASTPQIHEQALVPGSRSETVGGTPIRVTELGDRFLASWLGPWLVVVDVPRLGPAERNLIEQMLSVFPAGRE